MKTQEKKDDKLNKEAQKKVKVRSKNNIGEVSKTVHEVQKKKTTRAAS